MPQQGWLHSLHWYKHQCSSGKAARQSLLPEHLDISGSSLEHLAQCKIGIFGSCLFTFQCWQPFWKLTCNQSAPAWKSWSPQHISYRQWDSAFAQPHRALRSLTFTKYPLPNCKQRQYKQSLVCNGVITAPTGIFNTPGHPSTCP